jgi:xylulose-5-phosphate/fructose-6-phosphate phosphoketolase
VHGHPDVDRIHLRGFNEQGTITTPFQMVVMNEMSCFPLAAEAIRLVPHLRDRTPALPAECEARIAEATAYAQEHFEDQPEIRDRVWTD